ncbi:hypothetical protein FRC09_019503 [Ceratobasidium sp. 395]|nr:hypothetical protein FRC09_019503 [Ceratobasidium sp. 395]
MSLPTAETDGYPSATIPWLLNPQWEASLKDRTTRLRTPQPPREIIRRVHDNFQDVRSGFFRPLSLNFKDGKPIMDEDYVEILRFKRECGALVAELRELRAPEEYQDQCSREISAITDAVEEIDSWVDEQRVLALAEEDEMAKFIAERRRMALERGNRGFGATALWFVNAAFSSLV